MATLVTGAAGFIGFHAAEALLARGEEVIGLDNLNHYYHPALKQARLARLAERHGPRFRLVRADFAAAGEPDASLAQLEFDRVVHLGAQPGARHSTENPLAYGQSNLTGHLHLLELARRRGSSHFVYASSSAVYGGNRQPPFSVDQRVDHPLSLYAATKRAAELMSESYASLYRLPQTGLRLFTVYGPWGRPDMAVWIFTRAVIEGRAVPLFNRGDMRRAFTYIDDAVAGIIACLDSPPADDGVPKPGGSSAPHAIYNIGNPRSEDLMTLVQLIEQAVGTTALRDPRPMQPGEVRDTFAEISAIQRDLGFQPRVTLEQGIPRFVRWYRDYHGV